jgi:hypothetical protein
MVTLCGLTVTPCGLTVTPCGLTVTPFEWMGNPLFVPAGLKVTLVGFLSPGVGKRKSEWVAYGSLLRS